MWSSDGVGFVYLFYLFIKIRTVIAVLIQMTQEKANVMM